jgi:hypothetical protein
MEREEAIKRIKEWNLGSDKMEILSTAIPELKNDSVDRIKEIIRKALDSYYIGKLSEGTNDVDYAMCLAWLDKNYSDYNFEIKHGHWYKCVCDYMHPNFSSLMYKCGKLYYCRCDWRLAGEIDERNVKNIGVNGYKTFFRPATNQEITDWLKSHPQLKQAQSEEDKHMIQALTNCIEELEGTNGWNYVYVDGHDIPICDLKNWLKLLMDRVTVQFTQEWSKEDEKMWNALMKDAYNPKYELWGIPSKDILNWLKSVKNRISSKELTRI